MPQPPPNTPFTVDYPRSSDDVLRSLQRAYERINSLQQTISTLPLGLTESQVKALIGPTANSALSIGGSNPLVIQEIINGNSIAQIISGTHAQRIALTPATITQQTLYFETDRTVYYQLVNSAFIYTAGKMSSALANIPGDLGSNDAGFLFYATDYQHTYYWDGAVWSYAPGDEGSGFIRHFTVAPRSGKWQKLDGSTGITESLANGTTALVAFSGLAAGAVPDLIGTPTYLRFNTTCTGVVVLANSPTFVGSPATLTGTVASTLAMNSYTPAGTNSGPIFTGTAVTITNAAFTTIGTTALTSFGGSTTTYTPQGLVSAPVFAGTPATLTGVVTSTLTMNPYTPAGAISNTGEPRHLDTIPYYRL